MIYATMVLRVYELYILKIFIYIYMCVCVYIYIFVYICMWYLMLCMLCMLILDNDSKQFVIMYIACLKCKYSVLSLILNIVTNLKYILNILDLHYPNK